MKTVPGISNLVIFSNNHHLITPDNTVVGWLNFSPETCFFPLDNILDAPTIMAHTEEKHSVVKLTAKKK